MKIVALPALVVPELHDSEFVKNKTWALISITHEDGAWPNLNVKEDDKNFKGVLKLFFADIDKESEGWVLFSEEHANQILDFVESRHPFLDLLIIHCLAGLSRSPGAAAAISKIYLGHDGEFFNTKTPNMLVYSTILKTYSMRKHSTQLTDK